ncbi:MAG: glycoside hydrolase family 25 protein [Bacteroidaceae bacterium]|nr:glycoside hydrolase family 25 protein [Bacteroidaceae bacterium]
MSALVGGVTTYLLGNSPKVVPPEEVDGCEHADSAAVSDYQGIDVSNHQGEISWSDVARDKNIRFVYIKASEGATFKDGRYKENVKGARKNGILVGSYHFIRNTSLIRKQFENFKSMAAKDEQDLIPMVDVEERVDKDSILLFCELVKKHYGRLPMIYGTMGSYNSYCAPDFNSYYLMIGRYGSEPPVIRGKGHYNIWQYKDTEGSRASPSLLTLTGFIPILIWTA